MFLLFEKVGHVEASEPYLLNLSRESFEEISPIRSCRKLSGVSFEIRTESLK